MLLANGTLKMNQIAIAHVSSSVCTIYKACAHAQLHCSMVSPGSAFLECAATDFSSCCLQWRELCLIGISGMMVTERGKEERTFGGGFRYQGSATLSSPCRNRSILW